MQSLKQIRLVLIPSHVTLVDNQTSLHRHHCLLSHRDNRVLMSCRGRQGKVSALQALLPRLAFCHEIHTYPFFLQHTAHSLRCHSLCSSCCALRVCKYLKRHAPSGAVLVWNIINPLSTRQSFPHPSHFNGSVGSSKILPLLLSQSHATTAGLEAPSRAPSCPLYLLYNSSPMILYLFHQFAEL